MTAAAAGFVLLAGGSSPSTADRWALMEADAAPEIPDPDLPDVAVAVYDPVTPVIYYNPDLRARIGPDLATFLMAHERAHLLLRHTRRGLPPLPIDQRRRKLQRMELEADCLAAARLGRTDPEAVQAAVRFFSRLGYRRFDLEHPAGAERAARILSCLPA